MSEESPESVMNSALSPTQTKFLLCSDEEIIRNVDQRRTYRQGWPRLPPLPVRYIHEGTKAAFQVNGTEEILEKLFDQVWEIWLEEGLGIAKCHLAFRPPIAEQPTDTDADTYLTVMIVAFHRPSWNPLNAIVRLRKFMQHHVGTRGLYIEYLIGLPHDNGLTHSSALDRKADAYYLKHHEEIYTTALSEIKKFDEQWIMLSLSRRGLYDVSSTIPTLVIETPTANNLAWDEIVKNLRLLWKYSMPKLEIEVYCRTSQWTEILCRAPNKNDDMSRPHIGLFPDDFSSRMTMGSSIGREGTDHSGTAGGMVKLDNGNCYALSNHHVVGLDDAGTSYNGLQTEMTELARIHKHSSPYLRKPDARVLNRVASPSDQDKIFFEEEQHMNVAWAENALWNIEHSLFSRRWKAKVRMSVPYLDFKDETLSDLAKSMAFESKRHLGTVYASSGFRTARSKRMLDHDDEDARRIKTFYEKYRELYNLILDWSLTEICKPRAMYNEIPSDTRYIERRPLSKLKKPLTIGQRCVKWTTLAQNKFDFRLKDVPVTKYGPITGLTAGTINAPVMINPSNCGFNKIRKN